ncbi:glucose-1-phosphate adenylyltransferase subunit GlgD [Pectinatus haikarae]|uniref:glucose-1-phosphate adenylyltransferase subunit GlgD n=1 Tax=Pectinatus haikarae TaxID=349096 RepID=UPI0018C76CBF|nr:glucose-1-phosphate adenylyltransferase subunit GlgD [Pectinatus haikarae]
MNYVLGLINLHEDNRLIKEITRKRPIATIPFAGRYRLIDFILSSMVNSGIISVGIMLPDKAASILDHLRSGKDWDLARRHEGLFYLLPSNDDDDIRQSELKTFYQNLNIMRRSPQEYILLSGAHTVFNIDFNNVLRFHQNTNADITMLYYRPGRKLHSPCTVIKTKENGLVSDIANCPAAGEDADVSMGTYLMSRKVFLEIVEHSYERGGSDFLLDGIMRMTAHYNIYGCCYDGYVSCINSLYGYYQTSMDLLNPQIWNELFIDNAPIYTRTKDDVPAQYKSRANVHNSLISNGCTIEGLVENSILFRDVRIEKGVKIKNSIIMQGCQLHKNSCLENVICDKNVTISAEKYLKGAESYPLIVEKNTVI